MNETFLDFDQVTTLVGSVAEQIDKINFIPNRVVGVGRGGCMPASMLSYYFGAPLTVVDWSSSNRNECLAWICEDLEHDQKVLVVDNIVSSGETIKLLLDDWVECHHDRDLIRQKIKDNLVVAAMQTRKSAVFLHENICKLFAFGETCSDDEFFVSPNDKWWG